MSFMSFLSSYLATKFRAENAGQMGRTTRSAAETTSAESCAENAERAAETTNKRKTQRIKRKAAYRSPPRLRVPNSREQPCVVCRHTANRSAA